MSKKMNVSKVYNKYLHKGYVGPKYNGMTGKLRLLIEGYIGHVETVVYAEPSFWSRCDYDVDSRFRLEKIDTYNRCKQYLSSINNAYYEGYTSSWATYYSWGESLWLLFYEDDPAYYMWSQIGGENKKCIYVPLKQDEYRFYRGGTLPRMRNKKALTAGHILSLEYLFRCGARRVYTEAYENNIYSTRGHVNSGYKLFGRIYVSRSLVGKTKIRWI